jgi:hypothetical protein
MNWICCPNDNNFKMEGVQFFFQILSMTIGFIYGLMETNVWRHLNDAIFF